MRRLHTMGLGIAVCLTLVSCSGQSSSDSSQPATPTASTPSSQADIPTLTKTADPRDQADPDASGCSPSAVEIKGTSVPVLLASGEKYGDLVLMRSTACNAIWGRVVNIVVPGVTLHVNVTRPSDHAATPEFTTTDGSPSKPVFTDMLSHKPGCVRAQAHVDSGPVAQTPCSQG